jgi:hypothetical protein
MRPSRKDQEKHKNNQGKDYLEVSVDQNSVDTDSEEVAGIFEDTNEKITKTFKHLGKVVETKF